MHRQPPNLLPYRISTLVFLQNDRGELLLIRRLKAPNRDCWSPIGGKLQMDTGESPYECAARETVEETGFPVTTTDLHCFGYVAEKAYEGEKHWLMFLFRVIPPIPFLPAGIDEGTFGFFPRDAIDKLKIPPTDHQLVWPVWDHHRHGFAGLRADCSDQNRPVPTWELIVPDPRDSKTSVQDPG